MFGGFGGLFSAVQANPNVQSVFSQSVDPGAWLAMILLSSACVLLLPRQFHVLVVEHDNSRELARARWLFPAYLVAINLFVVPIAAAGLLTFGPDTANADMYVLTLPISAEAHGITLLAFIGGLSAATAMVIVATIALSVMVSNELVVPVMLKRQDAPNSAPQGMGARLLFVRRASIFAILILAYAYYKLTALGAPLAAIGLLSFAAIVQLAPAFFGGLLWRGGTAKGAIAGMTSGIFVWGLTLLIPTLVEAGAMPPAILSQGLFGIGFLKPQTLFNVELDPIANSVLWSLIANIVTFVAVSLAKAPEPIERLQAGLFVPIDRSSRPSDLRRVRTSVTVGALEETISGYLGADRTKRAFEDHAEQRGIALEPDGQADIELIRFAEHMLASAIGAASSRIVMSLLLRRKDVSAQVAMKLLDDASTAIQQNRDLLQTALDQVDQGIAVFNPDMQLVCWNRQFRQLLQLPPNLGMVGVAISEITGHCAARGEFGPGDLTAISDAMIDRLMAKGGGFTVRFQTSDIFLEIGSNTMPDGGMVVTFNIVTQRVKAKDDLARANETLEKRVADRTEQLTRANDAMKIAKADADRANHSKTRFLAAAGHDVMQPLNAARLYVSGIAERSDLLPDVRTALSSADSALEGVEDILGSLLDISKLDSGAVKAERVTFPISDVFDQIKGEFEQMARERSLEFTVVPSSQTVRTDKRLLRRVLRNLVSNAIKYTKTGGIVVGCRRRSGSVIIQVVDTGVGIPSEKLDTVFKEFQRLDTVRGETGLGLGLSIVERLCRMLDHAIDVRSREGKGSSFSVTVPAVRVPLVGRHKTPDDEPANDPVRRDDRGIAQLSILCIDNEPAILDAMTLLLEEWGCTVFTATDRKEALDAVNDGARIDCIFADYHLDSGTGVDVIRQVRWALDASIPAVLISADRTDQVRGEAQEKNLELLAKPVKPAALRALLTQLAATRAAAE
ncbi:MAG: PAS domain-containing hybrid sensor histidine kinase/response regulator [Pseudomonadota bacterium]